MLFDHFRETGNELVSLGQKVGQPLVLLLVNELAVALLVLEHEPPHALLLNALLLPLLLLLCVHVVGGHGLVYLAYLLQVLPVELPKKHRKETIKKRLTDKKKDKKAIKKTNQKKK